MKPMFSIIVPIYKVEQYLSKCIDSVLKQTYDNFELILVDDGSPDNCPKICDKYAKKDKRVKVIHKKNGGLVSARNAGLNKAKGEYIFNLDGDDWLKNNSLEKLFEKAIKRYNPDVIVSNMTKVYSDKEEEISTLVKEGFYDKKALLEDIYPYMMWDYRKKFYTGLIFPSSGGKIIKRELLQKHYCKNEKIRMGEDNAFIFECMYFADNAFFLDDHFYMYVQSDESMVKKHDSTRFSNNKILIEYIEEHLGGMDKTIDSQINSFKAYWLMMAIFHEAKCKMPILESTKHVKNNIKKYKPIEDIKINALPFFPKLYIFFLRLHLYFIVVLMSNFVQRFRK